MAWALAGTPDIAREQTTGRRRECRRYRLANAFRRARRRRDDRRFLRLFLCLRPDRDRPSRLHVKQTLKADAQGFGLMWAALGVGSVFLAD